TTVVASQDSVPSASGASVGTVKARAVTSSTGTWLPASRSATGLGVCALHSAGPLAPASLSDYLRNEPAAPSRARRAPVAPALQPPRLTPRPCLPRDQAACVAATSRSHTRRRPERPPRSGRSPV